MLRHLVVRQFRGVAALNWTVPEGAACLIGPGDSAKTTILDAVHLVLGAHYTTTIHDHDFYRRDLRNPIVIEATVTGIPEELLAESRYGLELRGWTPTDTVRDEPDDGDEEALTVRFSVDETLEPSWTVVNDRNPEGKRISWRDRQRLGAARVGVLVERDLRWTRGSALTRLTGSTDTVDKTLAEAHRQAREAVGQAQLSELEAPIALARRGAVELAAGQVTDDLHAALDTRGSEARLGLHSRDIPMALFGQGARRLTALGLQLAAAADASTLSVDEIEHALEPWRVRHLVRVLKGKLLDDEHPLQQLMCTTHSSVVVEQFDAAELHVVRRDASTGSLAITAVPKRLQALVRSTAEAFLARRVIVCEGSTELGICMELDDPKLGPSATPMSHAGATLTKGDGSSCAQRAMSFHELGFEVALVADSDRELSPGFPELERAGITIVRWAGTASTEERVFQDVPIDGLTVLVDGLCELHGDQVRETLASSVGVDIGTTGIDLAQWVCNGAVDEQALRDAAVRAATSREGKWLKSIPAGRLVGRVLCSHWKALAGVELRTKLESVLSWATR